MSRNEPSKISVIMYAKPGYIIPEDMVKRALAARNTAMGYVVRAEDVLCVEHGETPTFEEFMELQTNAKDYPAIFWLAKLDKHTDRMSQPFFIKHSEADDDEATLVAYCLEGDFPASTDPEVSDERKLNDELIFPRLADIAELAGDDMAKLHERLAREDFGKFLNNTIGHRGVFAFISKTGEPLFTGKNELGGEFEWGTTSQLLGYSEGAAAVAPQLSPKKFGGSLRKVVGMGGGPKAEAPVLPASPPPPPAGPVADPTPAADTTSPPPQETTAKENGHYEDIPRGLSGKERKAYIRKFSGGKLPPDHKTMTKVWVQDGPAGSQSNVVSIKDAAKDAGIKVTSVHVPAPATNGKDLKELGAMMEVAVSQAASITDRQQTGAMEYILKHLDASSNAVMSPLELQKSEAKFPSFSEKVCPIQDVFRWRADGVKDFMKAHPDPFLISWLELRRIAMSHPQYQGVLEKMGLGKTNQQIESEKAPVAEPRKAEPQKKEEPAAIVEQPKKVASGGARSRRYIG